MYSNKMSAHNIFSKWIILSIQKIPKWTFLSIKNPKMTRLLFPKKTEKSLDKPHRIWNAETGFNMGSNKSCFSWKAKTDSSVLWKCIWADDATFFLPRTQML